MSEDKKKSSHLIGIISKDARLVFLILVYDLYQLGLFFHQTWTKSNVTINMDWIDLGIKIFIVVVLYQVIKDYQQLFSQFKTISDDYNQLQEQTKYRLIVWDYLQEKRYKEFSTYGLKFMSEEDKALHQDEAYQFKITEDFHELEDILFAINPKLSKEDVIKVLTSCFPYFSFIVERIKSIEEKS